MPNNKKQHFVPKYMLKNFAADDKLKTINLVHIPSKKIVYKASLRDQCYRDYFYGADIKMEQILADIEGVHSKLLREAINQKNLASWKDMDLALFVVLQISRTKRSEITQTEMFNPLMKMALHGKIDEEVLRSVSMNFENNTQFMVSMALSLAPMIYDLKACFVFNDTNIPFVLSDNPVIKTNWFCRVNFPNNNGLGFANSGLQFFIPVTPLCGIFLYDSGIYDVRHKSGLIIIDNCKDVHGLNLLQWHNAHKCIYFAPEYGTEYLKKLIDNNCVKNNRVKFTRAENHSENDEYIPNNKDEYASPNPGVKSEIIMISSQQHASDIRFSGLSMKIRKKFYNDGSLASPIRDPVWVQIVKDFSKAIEVGEVLFSDFHQFLSGHPLASNIGSILRAKQRKYILNNYIDIGKKL